MMSNEMIERCVEAALRVRVTALDLGKPEITVEDVVRAQAIAIIRTMREPTEEMVDAGYRDEYEPKSTRLVWTAMIDEALR